MARVHAVANQKGGVGKSSCVYCLARALQRKGRRVLVVDFDPQGNLTRALTEKSLTDDQATVADVISPDARSKTGHATHTMDDVMVSTVFPGVDLVPARIELSVAEVNIMTLTGREHRLREALTPVRDRYDDILIDCPPALGQLTINGLTAADDVLIVTEAEQWSADGMGALRDTIDRVRSYMNPDLTYAGVIINRFRPGTKLHAAGAEDIERYFTQAAVWRPYVSLTIAVPESIAAGIGVDDHGSFTADRVADTFAGYADTLIKEAH